LLTISLTEARNNMILKEKRFIDFIIYPNQLHLSLLSFINTTLGVSNLCLKLYAGFGYEAGAL
jgi:hypothetical protein